jgi:hypothetical protein
MSFLDIYFINLNVQQFLVEVLWNIIPMIDNQHFLFIYLKNFNIWRITMHNTHWVVFFGFILESMASSNLCNDIIMWFKTIIIFQVCYLKNQIPFQNLCVLLSLSLSPPHNYLAPLPTKVKSLLLVYKYPFKISITFAIIFIFF